MANQTVTTRYAEIAKTKIAADFSLGTVIEWRAEGAGANFWLITRTADTVQNNTPVANVSVVTRNYKKTPAADIFNMYFNSLPPGFFAGATMLFTDTTVQVWRNVEEN